MKLLGILVFDLIKHFYNIFHNKFGYNHPNINLQLTFFCFVLFSVPNCINWAHARCRLHSLPVCSNTWIMRASVSGHWWYESQLICFQEQFGHWCHVLNALCIFGGETNSTKHFMVMNMNSSTSLCIQEEHKINQFRGVFLWTHSLVLFRPESEMSVLNFLWARPDKRQRPVISHNYINYNNYSQNCLR